MQLVGYREKFAELGVNVAAMTYDPIDVNLDFKLSWEIPYPLMSDVNGTVVKAFGILNEEYGPEHFAHGVPLPGIMLILSDGAVVLKRAEEAYQNRPDLDELLLAVQHVVES